MGTGCHPMELNQPLEQIAIRHFPERILALAEQLISVPELTQAVDDYIAGHNRNPKPFIWSAQATDILEKTQRARKKLNKLQSV